MSELCKFYKNGNIIYQDVNLIDLTSSNIFLDITNSEIVNINDIYINVSTKIYYHKFQYGSSFTFLEWKMSKDGDWEWFKSDIIIGDLTKLKQYLEYPTKIEPEEIDLENLKNDIIKSLKDLSDKYQLNQKQYDYMLEKMIYINDIKNLK
jgi:hypothetical protein